MSADGFPAGKSADGLVDHCLEDGSRQIFLGCSFVDQWLYVCLGKYTAPCGNGIKCLVIFGIFIPIAAYILMQDRINTICTLPPQKERKNTDSAALENIQKLKALLDSGAITQEEFEAKKKEFLGI